MKIGMKLKKSLSAIIAVVMVITLMTPSVKADNAKEKTNANYGELKIASYNIAAKGGKTTEIGNLLKEKEIDIAGFQEVDKNTGRNPKDMLKEIAETAGYYYSFRKSIDYSGGEYGIGIATKEEIIDSIGDDLVTNGYEGRGWQRVQIQVDGKTVSVYNTHLTWEDLSVRASQMRTLMNQIESDETEYKVITGDFNAQESNDEFDLFLRNYNIANGYNEEWLDTYIPFDASMQTNAIDNIITTRNMKLKNVEAEDIQKIGSDHRVLVATYELLEDEEVSTQLLTKKMNQCQALLSETTRYTEESLSMLNEKIKAAESASKETQKEVNAIIDDLEEGITNLERIPIDPTKPVAYWDFEGENPMQDKTGRGNDGEEKGTVRYEKGLENLGQALSTKDGYVSVKKVTDDLNLGTKDFSVGFWYKATNPGTWSAVIGDKNWSSGANPGMVVVQGQGQFYTSYAANGHSQQENIVTGTASKVYDNKWHYITAVLDRDDKSKLYVDGQMIAATSIKSTADMNATVSTPFNIGADGAGNYRINSLIDEVKVYNSVLSEEEIEAEYLKNCDKSEAFKTALIKETEKYLEDLVVDPKATRKLDTFESEDGKYISKIFCSENDMIVDDEGNIQRTPLVDKKVQVTYIIQENNSEVAYDEGEYVKNKWITVKGEKASGKNEQPVVVPTLQEWCGADKGTFAFTKDTRIILSEKDQAALQQAADILKSDIKELFDLDVAIVSDTPAKGDIVLTLGRAIVESEDEETKELVRQSYQLDIEDYITITGTDYKGIFYGTRSVLQAMIMSDDNTIACGTVIDYPNYPVRKFMLDLGRKYFPMWYLNDVVKYASWLKLTDFQAHVSEDTFNDYAAFRLESDIKNLTSKDGYYTKDEYREFQKHASDYGIRVITEIDTPAHSRCFINLGNYPDAPEEYKNLGLDGTHFNLSEANGAREKVFNLMDSVLDEYLGGEDPVIITDAFNIGMDEYFADKNDLRAYAVHMMDKIVNEYGKTGYAWDSDGTLANDKYPKDQYPMDNMVIDFWKWEEVSGGLKALMDQGYKVVNGDHRWYIVPGAQIGFYDYANEERLFNEATAGSMVGWYGNGTIFPEGHPSIVGGTMLLWNDRGMFAGYTVNDIFARQRSQYPYLAQNYWYGKEDNLTFDEFKKRLNKIEVGPGLDNLYKDIDSESDLVYDLDMENVENGIIADQSGNGYDAKAVGASVSDGPDGKQLTFDGNGYITTQHKALKWPYTAVFDLTIDEKQTGDITLFEEVMPEQGCVKKDGNLTGQETREIVLKEQEDHTYKLTYARENFEFVHDFTFEKGKAYRIAFVSDESKITGGEYSKWNQPNKLYVNGQLVSTLQGPAKPESFTGTWWVDSPSMNMPLEKIGQNLVGSLDNFKLYNRLLTDAEIKDLGELDNTEIPEKQNIALHKPAEASSQKNDSFKASGANDGDMNTRWGSNYNSSTNDPFDKVEWLTIDLESKYALEQIVLHWQSAYAEEYTIQVSDDGENFTDAMSITGGDGKEDVIDLSNVTGRYVRINCTKAVPSNDGWKWNYGYSLYEVEVYGEKVQEYKVTFDVDGSESIVIVTNVEGSLGNKMPENPRKDGYVFKEWNTQADGKGETVTSETKITEDMTVYAIFRKESNNIALDKPAEASSHKSDNLKAANVNDGDMSTRWASNYNSSTNDPFDKVEWLTLDLENKYTLEQLVLHWETAYAEEYTIQVSDDGENFTDAMSITGGDGKEDVINLSNVTGRYVRIYCTKAVPSNDSWKWNYGYSLYEVEVYGKEFSEPEEPADKADLLALIEYAKEQKETAEYKFLVPAVKTAFEAALDKASEIMKNNNATQDDVDKAYDRLLKLVQMLDFTGNNTALSKLVQQVENLKPHLYTTATWEVFAGARTKAQGVLNNPNSLQAEIDEARVVLRNAIFGLRLIPDKGQLENLIKGAEAVDTANYTVKSATAFAAALDHAKEVFADAEATEEDVKAAEAALKEAQKNLVAKENPEEDADKEADNKVASDDGSKKEASKSAAKTGDAAQTTAVMMTMLMAAVAAVLSFRRKRS